MPWVDVHCGVLNHPSTPARGFFFPVLQAKYIHSEFNLKLQQPYALIFTSAIAVQAFFCVQTLSVHQILENLNLISIFCVGNQTTEYLKEKLRQYNFTGIQQKLSPALKHEGLEAVLKELNGYFTDAAYVLTSLEGKTKTILQETNFSFQVYPIFLYELIALNDFSWLSRLNSKDSIIFHCRSGKVLGATVNLVCQYYKIPSPKELTDQFLFSLEKKSAADKARDLGLIHVVRNFG